MKFYAVLKGILKKDLVKLMLEKSVDNIKKTLKNALQIDKFIPGFKDQSKAAAVAKASFGQSEYAYPIYVLECTGNKGIKKGKYTYPKGTIDCFNMDSANAKNMKVHSVLLSHMNKTYKNIDLTDCQEDMQNSLPPVKRSLKNAFDDAIDLPFDCYFEVFKNIHDPSVEKTKVTELQPEEIKVDHKITLTL